MITWRKLTANLLFKTVVGGAAVEINGTTWDFEFDYNVEKENDFNFWAAREVIDGVISEFNATMEEFSAEIRNEIKDILVREIKGKSIDLVQWRL